MPDLDIKIRTTADVSGADQAAQAIGKVESATKQASTSTAQVGRTAKGTATELRELGQAGQGAQQAMAGLSQGGVAGLVMALRGLGAVVKGLAASGLGALLVPVGLVAAALYGMGKAAEAARDKLFGTGERTKAVADSMARLAEASEKNIKKATEDADKLAAAYDRVTSSIENALRRFNEIESARAEAEVSSIELERQKALSGALTDQERTQINDQFDKRVASSKNRSPQAKNDEAFFRASQSLTESLSQKRLAQGEIDKAAAKVSAAKKVEDEARAAGNVNAFGEALRARESAEKELEIITKKNQPTLDNAEKNLADTDAKLKVLGYEQTTLKNTRLTEGFTSLDSGRDRARSAQSVIPGLDKRYEELTAAYQSTSDIGEQNRLAAEAEKIRTERDKAYSVIKDLATSEQKARADLERDLKANKERSGGG